MRGFGGDYDVVVGVDVGKLSHRACAVTPDGRALFNVGFGNDERSIDRVLDRAAPRGRVLVVVDQRRNIGTTVIRRARAAGDDVAYMPGIAMHNASKLFPGDAKTDERDAEVIARTAVGMPSCLRPVPEEGSLEGARRLEAQRADLLKDRTHQANRLRAMMLESCPAFERAMRPCEPWCVRILERLGGPWNIRDAGRRRLAAAAKGAPPGAVEAPWDSASTSTRPTEEQVEAEAAMVPMIARRIREDTEDIRRLDALIGDAVRGDETYRCLLTVPGVGPRTAAQLVLDVDVDDFADHDHLASYCGLAPRNRQSGTSLNSVSSTPQGNRQLKNLLIFSCSSLARSSGYYRDYFESCRSRGKPYKAALKAVARKRLKVIFAVMRDRVPYDPGLQRG
jgi:transposase